MVVQLLDTKSLNYIPEVGDFDGLWIYLNEAFFFF